MPSPPRHRAHPRSRFVMPMPPIGPSAQHALTALPITRTAMNIFWLLALINFMNYLDRFIFVAVVPILSTDLHLNNAEIGLTTSSFLLIYTLTALPMGFLADRTSRTHIIAIGVALWSLATWYTAISTGFWQLFLGRALLGIGEASYVPAGIALLSAYFAPERRARVLSNWGVGSLVGMALGYVLGGLVAQIFNWRWAFILCGPPGLSLAWVAWRAPDRAAYEPLPAGARARSPFPSTWKGLLEQGRRALQSPVVRLATVIQALGLFFTTPAVIFIPVYLHTHFHLSVGQTALLAAIVLIPGGVLGTVLGGVVADLLSKRFAGGRMLAVAISFVGAAPFFLLALLAGNLIVMLIFAMIATIFINLFNGPLNAIIQDVVPTTLRASAAAIVMTLAHLAGDVGSPTLVGRLADNSRHIGTAGSLLILGVPALVLGAIASLWGVRVYVHEMRQRSPEPEGEEPSDLVLSHI